MQTLNIRLLGEFQVSLGSNALHVVNTPRFQSLLIYLLLNRDKQISRQQLAFIFWPDASEKQARTNLRRLLYRLRKAFPETDNYLQVDSQTLQWRSDASVSLDVANFEDAVAEAARAQHFDNQTTHLTALEKAVAHYTGDLIPNHYDEWITPERDRLHQLWLTALEQLTHGLEDRRDYDKAIQLAQLPLQRDPLYEPGYQRLMQLQALNLDRAGILRTYHRCTTVFQQELGIDPAQATTTLYHQLLNGDGAAVTQAEARPQRMTTIPLVGRISEWQQLRTAWQKASRGQAHLVAIAGEAGIGKSRLAEELG